MDWTEAECMQFQSKSLPEQQYPDALREYFLSPDLILLDRDRVFKVIEFDPSFAVLTAWQTLVIGAHHGLSTDHHADTCWHAAHGHDGRVE